MRQAMGLPKAAYRDNLPHEWDIGGRSLRLAKAPMG